MFHRSKSNLSDCWFDTVTYCSPYSYRDGSLFLLAVTIRCN